MTAPDQTERDAWNGESGRGTAGLTVSAGGAAGRDSTPNRNVAT